MTELLGGRFAPATVPVHLRGQWVRSPIGLWKSMREDDLQGWIYDLCAAYGAVCFHEPSSRRQRVRGWPDCVIIGSTAMLWRELKRPREQATPQQLSLGWRLINMQPSQDWAVWRPADLADGAIETQIARCMGR